jgi:predicted CopG family antitoxin
MGTRNISISDEAYERLKALKKPRESFTDVINRLTGKRSILELAGILSKEEAKEMKLAVKEIRKKSSKRVGKFIKNDIIRSMMI